MNANAATVTSAPALMRRAGTLDTVVTLARRELWEHRSLWIAPLVVLAVLAVLLLVGHIQMDLPEHLLTVQDRVAILTIVQCLSALVLSVVTSIVVTFYLLDCLYAERKDRSILFWKSLPLSDTVTVGSKLLVAMVVVPIGVLVLAAVGGFVFAAILAIRIPGTLSFDPVIWLRTEWALLISTVIGVLWYAPIAAALLLFSAWIRRNPILWAILVPVMAPIVEYVALHTTYIGRFENYRINGIWHVLFFGHEPMFARMEGLPSVDTVLGVLNYRAVFTNADLWLGVIAAAVMIYAAIRVRRYRDDT